MRDIAAFPAMLSVHDTVSYDTRPGPKRRLLAGRSDQIRHFQLRDARGCIALEGGVEPSRDLIPFMGLDFGSVFASPSIPAPMDGASPDPASQRVGRGVVAKVVALARGLFINGQAKATRCGIAGSNRTETVFEKASAETCCRNPAGDRA